MPLSSEREARRNALLKTCQHLVQNSFDSQVSRLCAAGYPMQLLTAVAGSLLKKCNTGNRKVTSQTPRKKVVVVPYMHNLSHNLKKIGKRVGVDVVFSAPLKLSGLCARVNNSTQKRYNCSKKHRDQFVPCAEGVVYSITLSCGKEYVGQTGRCLNDRLREHSYNVTKLATTGHLAAHCMRCGCKPIFNETKVIARSSDQMTREIVEAFEINKSKDCVSCPSVSLTQKEIAFLSR